MFHVWWETPSAVRWSMPSDFCDIHTLHSVWLYKALNKKLSLQRQLRRTNIHFGCKVRLVWFHKYFLSTYPRPGPWTLDMRVNKIWLFPLVTHIVVKSPWKGVSLQNHSENQSMHHPGLFLVLVTSIWKEEKAAEAWLHSDNLKVNGQYPVGLIHPL